jgi:MinD-like ATPase involved in chromosome partitioning or flagellar assembly
MGKIVSIHSFRGGTGKSNLTANLAAQVALEGKRVGVVDTDIQSPGIHVLFGLNEDKMGHTLNEYLRGDCAIEDVAFSVGENPGDVKGRKKLAGKDIWLIPSSINTGEITRILKDSYDPKVLNEGLQSLIKKLELDYLFIDTHPGLNEETLLSITISDILILILRPDQQDFQGTAVTVDVSRLLDVPQIFLVVNKALSRFDFKQVRSEIEGVYSTPVASVLPLSEDLVANESADIFSLADPDHAWSKGIKEVADVILAAG